MLNQSAKLNVNKFLYFL